MSTRMLIATGLALFLLLNVSLMSLYVLVRHEGRNAPQQIHNLPVIKSLEPFALTSEKNKPFSSASLLGKVWVADFFFTSCPNPCPTMTRNMAGVAETLKDFDDVAFVSISVDPDTDTPQVLASYGKKYGADPERWNFLTGPEEAIKTIAVEGFLVGSVDDPIIHSPKFCLVDKRGRIRGYYTGTEDAEMDRLIADIHQLRKE